MHLTWVTVDRAEPQRVAAFWAQALGWEVQVAWEEEFPPEWPFRNVVLRDVEGNEFCSRERRPGRGEAVAGRRLAAAPAAGASAS